MYIGFQFISKLFYSCNVLHMSFPLQILCYPSNLNHFAQRKYNNYNVYAKNSQIRWI